MLRKEKQEKKKNNKTTQTQTKAVDYNSVSSLNRLKRNSTWKTLFASKLKRFVLVL